MYFLRLLEIVSADSDALVPAVIPPQEVGGEILFADVLQDPIPGRLERLLGKPAPRQRLLYSGEEEIVRRNQIL